MITLKRTMNFKMILFSDATNKSQLSISLRSVRVNVILFYAKIYFHKIMFDQD